MGNDKGKELFLKVINAERKLNFTNSGILGGFSQYFLRVLENETKNITYSQLRDGLKNYSQLKRTEKAHILENLERWVKNQPLEIEKMIDVKKNIGKKVVNEKSKSKKNTNELMKLPGVGPQKLLDLKKLGIDSYEDLLYYFPKRYEDRSALKDLRLLEHGAQETIVGRIVSIETIKPRPRLNILKVILENDTGKITAIWFNQNFLKKQLIPGENMVVTGKIEMKFTRQIMVSDYEIIDGDIKGQHSGGIIPIYALTQKINQRMLRTLIYDTLSQHSAKITEILPPDIKKNYKLMDLRQAILEMHFPTSWEMQRIARYALAFHELLIFHLGIKSTKSIIKSQKGIKHTNLDNLTEKFVLSLPFQLTKAQNKTIQEIKLDMECSEVMYRLIQGDVGSGKTVVALWALVKGVEGGFQGALMVPTEILAEQHFLNLKKALEPLNIQPVLLTGRMGKKEKEEKLKQLFSGEAKIIIGTHALIQSDVIFKNLGLIIVDEQHRFGVKQRLALQEKGLQSDLLVMTATPIPRTLALSLYGDMDISIIDELPPGRQEIKTYHVQENKRKDIYNLINREVEKGRQVYIVCPLVEESEKLDLINATELAHHLAKDIFVNYKIGLLHGQMKTEEKEIIMDKFRLGKLDIMVATTVIEVGIDVPNASIMIIENAERFGLAQLHQLRGRVGRGSQQSYCILVSDAKSNEAKARMAIMTKSNDGFIIAEEDLLLRGPGDFFGIKQHGLPDLKVADLLKDLDILEKTKKLAEEIIQEGLDQEKNSLLREEIIKKFSGTDILKG